MATATADTPFRNLGNRRNARQNGVLEEFIPLNLMTTSTGTILAPISNPQKIQRARCVV